MGKKAGAAPTAAQQNRANQLNPCHPAFHQSRGVPQEIAPVAAVAAAASAHHNRSLLQSQGANSRGSYGVQCGPDNSDPQQRSCAIAFPSRTSADAEANRLNRSNQLNPQRDEYWSCAGRAASAAERAATIEERRQDRRLEFWANTSAAKSPAQKAAIGRDVQRVEQVVKSALGGQAQIWKGGSQKKHTNISDSDLDLKLVTPKPFNLHGKDQLQYHLQRDFGPVDFTGCVLKFKGKSGCIDVVPNQATFFPPGFSSELPKNPFYTNDKGRHAVRCVKAEVERRGQQVKGYDAEMAVLKQQQLHPGIPLGRLVTAALEDLDNGNRII